MPTEPFLLLLDREGITAADKDLIARAAPLLREPVNYCCSFSRRAPSTSGCHPATSVTMNASI
jgi:hypothetical protein